MSIVRHPCVSNTLQDAQQHVLSTGRFIVVFLALKVFAAKFPNHASTIAIDVTQHARTLLHSLVLTSHTTELFTQPDHDFVKYVVSNNAGTEFSSTHLRANTHVVHAAELLSAKTGSASSLSELADTLQCFLRKVTGKLFSEISGTTKQTTAHALHELIAHLFFESFAGAQLYIVRQTCVLGDSVQSRDSIRTDLFGFSQHVCLQVVAAVLQLQRLLLVSRIDTTVVEYQIAYTRSNAVECGHLVFVPHERQRLLYSFVSVLFIVLADLFLHLELEDISNLVSDTLLALSFFIVAYLRFITTPLLNTLEHALGALSTLRNELIDLLGQVTGHRLDLLSSSIVGFLHRVSHDSDVISSFPVLFRQGTLSELGISSAIGNLRFSRTHHRVSDLGRRRAVIWDIVSSKIEVQAIEFVVCCRVLGFYVFAISHV